MKGGIANCPQCRKAVEVGGGPEPLFWLLLAAGGLAVLVAAAIAWGIGGTWAGLGALVLGALILGGIVLAS